MLNRLRRLAKIKQYRNGAVISPEDFKLPFTVDLNRLGHMFEIRKWFILNTPHKYYGEKYTNDMNNLHNEINYQQARLFLKRGALVFALLFAYSWFIDEPDAIDWKDTFDLKFSTKVYGGMVGAAGEGGQSIDD